MRARVDAFAEENPLFDELLPEMLRLMQKETIGMQAAYTLARSGHGKKQELKL